MEHNKDNSQTGQSSDDSRDVQICSNHNLMSHGNDSEAKGDNSQDSTMSMTSTSSSAEKLQPIKREIKILPKPAIGLSIGNIITNGPGKPFTSTYLIVTNLPPAPQPDLHIEVPPGKRKTQYSCSDCTLIFTSKAGLMEHLKKEHKKKKMFHCEYCDKDFCRKHVLASHIKTKHDKEKYHRCPKCDNEFHLKKLLNAHIEKEHKKEKFFSCPECNLEFHLRNAMMNHIKSVHRKTKAFQCDQCDARYSWKKSLNVHIDSTHKNVPQFKCDQCTSVFRWKTSLSHHYKAAHKTVEMQKYQCMVCSSTFSSEKRLNCHRKKVHKDESVPDVPQRRKKSQLKMTDVDGMDGNNKKHENINNQHMHLMHKQQMVPCIPVPISTHLGNASTLVMDTMHQNELPMPAHNHDMPIAAHRPNELPIPLHKHVNMPMPAHNYNNIPTSMPMPLPYVPYNPYYNCS